MPSAPTQRDALWAHPDVDAHRRRHRRPGALIARITGDAAEPDDIDHAIEELLGDESRRAPQRGLAQRV